MTSKLSIELVDIDTVRFDPANVRLHSAKNVEALKSSLARFGQQKPIVVDGDMVVRAGNGTLEAARALGWKQIAVVKSDLVGSEMTAFAIADNRTAELAEWDFEQLGSVLAALSNEMGSVEATGFTAGDVAALLGGPDNDAPIPGDGGSASDMGLSDMGADMIGENFAEAVEAPQHSCPQCGFRF